jgi:hypothetical protein
VWGYTAMMAPHGIRASGKGALAGVSQGLEDPAGGIRRVNGAHSKSAGRTGRLA